MIVSASYKTDIPTFYGEWFTNRLRVGYCKTVNRFNAKVSRISLRPEDVDGIVFWTKNVGPFLNRLAEVHERQIPFVIQHTINAYPRALEQAVIDAEKAVENMRTIADRFGPRVCVWRYDTVLLSSLTPREFHLETFARLAKRLQGSTDEVVVSFAHVYRKTLKNVTQAAEQHGFSWEDPSDEWKRDLLGELAQIADTHRIALTLCSQPSFLAPGCGEASCIDSRRLQDVSGRRFKSREKGNRPECRCSESRDVGEYDTCPHGCVYCYAVQNRDLALRRFREHDPASEFLFPPPPNAVEDKSERNPTLRLFKEMDSE